MLRSLTLQVATRIGFWVVFLDSTDRITNIRNAALSSQHIEINVDVLKHVAK